MNNKSIILLSILIVSTILIPNVMSSQIYLPPPTYCQRVTSINPQIVKSIYNVTDEDIKENVTKQLSEEILKTMNDKKYFQLWLYALDKEGEREQQCKEIFMSEKIKKLTFLSIFFIASILFLIFLIKKIRNKEHYNTLTRFAISIFTVISIIITLYLLLSILQWLR